MLTIAQRFNAGLECVHFVASPDRDGRKFLSTLPGFGLFYQLLPALKRWAITEN
jgi:hypothetical protein